MPYLWSEPHSDASPAELHIWPHRSLPPAGFAAFILTTFLFAMIPLIALLGTVLLWGLLPFVLLALWGVYYALQRNNRDRNILEVLTMTPEDIRLIRTNPRGDVQEWVCNTYWARVTMHDKGGPVPHYVTLSGSGREVEIGAFLSEEERVALFDELERRVARIGRA